jgi:hypothetical protein
MSHDRGLIEHTGVVIAALTYLIVLPLITYIVCTHFFSPRIYALWISTFNEDWNGSYSSHSFMWRFLEFNNWLAMKEKYYRLLLWRLVGGCSSKKSLMDSRGEELLVDQERHWPSDSSALAMIKVPVLQSMDITDEHASTADQRGEPSWQV